MPGIIPAANNAAIEISVELASTIIIMLGGIIPPMVELTPVTAAEKAAVALIPYLVGLFLLLFFILVIPELTMFLPNLMSG